MWGPVFKFFHKNFGAVSKSSEKKEKRLSPWSISHRLKSFERPVFKISQESGVKVEGKREKEIRLSFGMEN